MNARMIGRNSRSATGRYGCCRKYGYRGRRATVRSAKRREEREWRRQAS